MSNLGGIMFKNLSRDKIQAFIYNKSLISHKDKSIKILLVLLVIFVIPTSVLGNYAFFTSILFLPVLIFLIAIANKNLKVESLNTSNDLKVLESYYLFHGISVLLLSISCMVAACKLLDVIYDTGVTGIIITTVLYLLICAIIIYRIIYNIQRGYYFARKNDLFMRNSTIGAIIGVLVGRILYWLLSIYFADWYVTCLICAIGVFGLSFVFLAGINSILKYYFIRNRYKR